MLSFGSMYCREPSSKAGPVSLPSRCFRGGEWSVFSLEGRRLGCLQMPESLRPTEIAGDAVVGVSRSEVVAEIVQAYPLQRR